MAIKASTIPDSNDDFTVIVNANLSVEAKQIAVEHEMSHIKHDHFYKNDLNITSAESEAHGEEGSKLAKRYMAHIRVT